MAGRTGDRVGMAARHDVEHAFLVADLRHGQRKRRVHVAEQEVDLVALDQLARLLHRRARVAAGRILDQELDRPAENAALGVDLLDRELAADQLVFADRRKGPGERIVQPDFDRVRSPRLVDEWRAKLQHARRGDGFEHITAVDFLARKILWCHGTLLLDCDRETTFCNFAARASSARNDYMGEPDVPVSFGNIHTHFQWSQSYSYREKGRY